MRRYILRLQFFYVLLFLLGAIQVYGQGYVPLKQRHQHIQDSLLSVEYKPLSSREKCFYWLNLQWAIQDYDLTPAEKDPQVFKACLDSAFRWAKTPMDSLYIKLYELNYFAIRDSLLPFPPLPQNASDNLKALWHDTHFNYTTRLNLPPDSNDIAVLYAFARNTSTPILYRLNIADVLATYYYYPQKKFTEALNLYQVGVDFYEQKQIPAHFWHYSIDFPGHYIIPMQTVARCLLNGALVEERLGNYPQAIKNLGQGARSYKLLRDTMGLLWTYEQITEAYLAQNDPKQALHYLDSALSLVDAASFIASKAQYYAPLLSSSYELGHNPKVTKQWFDLFKKRIPFLKKSWGPNETDLLYTTSFWLSMQMASTQWNLSLDQAPNLNTLMEQVDQLVLDPFPNDESQRALARFHYGVLSAVRNKTSPTHNSEYRYHFSNIKNTGLQRYAYLQSKPLLQALGDYDMWKTINGALYDYSRKTVSALQCELSKDRSLIFEYTGQLDSALWYHKHYTTLRDSLSNRENYMQLAAADLNFRTARTKEEARLLKAQNTASKQQIVILLIISVASILIAFLIRTRRKRDNTIARNNAELLKLQIEAAAMRSKILKEKNATLQKELKESIAESIKYQSRNQDLMDSLELTPTTFSDKTTKVLHRKINSFSHKDNLVSLTEKAKEAYPELFEFLSQTEVVKNKTEMLYCILLAMGYSSEEIAITLQKSEKALKSMRYRVRKKLQVEKETYLRDYLSQI